MLCLLTVWLYFSVFLLPLRILSNLGKDGVVCVSASFVSHDLKEPFFFFAFKHIKLLWKKKSIDIVSAVGKQTFFSASDPGKKNISVVLHYC